MRLPQIHNRMTLFWVVAAFALTIPWFTWSRLEPLRGLFEARTARVPSQDTQVAPSDLPRTPGTFEEAKRVLYDQVYRDRRLTFYCGCTYSGRRVDLASCGLQPRKNVDRAARLEAEHVFPAHQFGQFRQCWREPICRKPSGGSYKGRKCCEETDAVFRTAHNDLMNLYPAEGEVNGDRSNYSWGMVPGEKRVYGQCNMEVDSSIRRAEPPENIMGDIARTMFYMEATYGFKLSDQDRKLFDAWNKMDPPDEWERSRNERIKKIQGRGNSFIENYPAMIVSSSGR